MEAPQEAEVDFSEVFSVDKIAYNAKALNYCRVFVAIISGCAAGILGQTGLLGFLTFFITTFLLSLTLYMKVKGDPKPYFKDAQAIWTEGVVQSLMSYVLFWTLFYDIVHICAPPPSCSVTPLPHCARVVSPQTDDALRLAAVSFVRAGET